MVKNQEEILGKDGIQFTLKSYYHQEADLSEVFCLVHCITESCLVAEELAQSMPPNTKLATYHMRGSLDPTKAEEINFELFVEDLEETMKTLRVNHLDWPITLFGRGFGANVVLSYLTERKSKEIDAVIIQRPWIDLKLIKTEKKKFLQPRVCQMEFPSLNGDERKSLKIRENFYQEIQSRLEKVKKSSLQTRIPIHLAESTKLIWPDKNDPVSLFSLNE